MHKPVFIFSFFIIFSRAVFLPAQDSDILRLQAEKRLAERGEVILKFIQPDSVVFGQLSKFLSVDKVQHGKVQAYANKDGFQKFLTYSLSYRLVDPPVLQRSKFFGNKSSVKYSFISYPAYHQYDSLMQAFAQSYPQICRLDTIGTSTGGKFLLVMKISDRAALDEAEPECMYSSTMHGDETGGYVLMLRLIHYLLSNYGTDTQVTALVDSMEIWINPLANPDGTYYGGDSTVSGAVRYNANGVDLNRNFPDPEDGPHPDGYDYQPETIAMMEFLNIHHISLSANFHAGNEVVNYPWDTWYRRHVDDDWFRFISHEYADTAHAYSSNYMTGFDNGITNGYDWYSISGGRQDYITFFLQGRETTIELDLSKITAESQLDLLWKYNFRSLLNYVAEANFGIHGFVTDSLTHFPVRATISIPGYDLDSSLVYTEPDSGFFVRIINAGQYDIEVKAEGYETKIIYGVDVINRQQTRLDIKLKFTGNHPPYVVNDSFRKVESLTAHTLKDSSFSVRLNVIDPEMADVDIDSGYSVSGNGTVVIDPPNDTSFNFIPTPGFVGKDTLMVRICDQDTLPACTWFTVYVSVDDPVIRRDLVVGQNRLTLYPNPATNRFMFNFYLEKPGKLVVYLQDIRGKLIRVLLNKRFNSGWHSEEASLVGLPNGIYIISLHNKDLIMWQKIIKIDQTPFPMP